MKEKHLDIVRHVLDHQLLDSNYVECGKVDDVELEGGPGELKVTAIITGPGATADRLPGLLRSLAQKVFSRHVTRVPWQEVAVITSEIKLRSRAENLGLDEADKKLAGWLGKLPGAE
ncbi:MAG TPA: hypothetical protein VFD58_28100 [Blastocatellia bacterium]|nr:hypothetical protein [Blastocatellia bacterium]